MNTILSNEGPLQGYLIPKTGNSNIVNEIKKELNVQPVQTCSFIRKKPESFNVYQENKEYIAIPKFYGLKKFGTPNINKELDGIPIDIKFTSELRPKQKEILESVIPHLEKKDGGVMCLPCGYGKCLALDTRVVMYNNSIKKVQDIDVGEYILGDDSLPRKVLSLGRGKEDMYHIIDERNPSSYYTVNKSHILALYNVETDKIVHISVAQYLISRNIHLKGYRVPIHFRELETEISPYKFGRSIDAKTSVSIPDEYKYNSLKNRKEVLFGILDENAYVNSTYYEMEIFNKDLLADITFIIHSIGFGIVNKTDIMIIVYIPLTRYGLFTYNINIKYAYYGDYYGFEIDGNRRFVLGDCSVTHNTILSLYIASYFKVKTLVIVHKTFLLEQWRERAREFTNAKVGIIQRDNIDIENKSIVIGMLQSIAKDKYDPVIFKDFGLVIFDEAHHAPSRYFSRALPIISCKKTLALSATPNRSDRLEKILYWYFGDIMYKLENTTNTNVIVNIYKYKLEHEKFKEFFLPTGDINRAKTINKLTTIGRRNKFIIDILYNILSNPNRKVIILSDRVEHLKAMNKRLILIDKTIISSYYIGGMKQSALKISEEARVIFATYSMAAEALDIPTLNTLFMVTPRREIEQSVGRILRKIDMNNRPIIYDFVDELPTFINQGKYRHKFYNKMKFEQNIINVENNIIIDTQNNIIEIDDNCTDFIDD
jgi:superfamily II DNA or RNA helicase